MSYFVGGKYKRYVNQDLNYDVNNGSLLVLDAAAPIVNDTKVVFDTTPLLPIKQHVDGIGIDAVSSSFFSAEAETAIRIHADNDPMIDLGGWCVQLDFEDGESLRYEMVPDRRPHDAVVFNTILSTNDTAFMSHKQLQAALSKGTDADREECLRAIEKEYNNFDKRCLWKCCPLPPGATLHRMILLGKVKNTAGGVKSCVKFRSVVDGAGYVPGRDCGFDTYAPCPQMVTARCMIHSAVVNDLELKSCDVAQAFTFGSADRRVFVKCPPGRKQTYGADGKPLCYEIVGNCYGSPSAPSRWHVEIHNSLIEFGFRQSAIDACLYIKGDLHVLVYTDDCLCTYPKTDAARADYASFIKMMTTNFELGDDGFQDCVDYIGMHLEWNADRTAVVITQPDKIAQLLTDSNLGHCRPSFTPGIPKTLVSDRDCPAEDDLEQKRTMASKPYRRRIGQLLWIARSSRPDIAYQVNALARVAHNPGLAHWKASTLLIRYVAHTQHMGLTFRMDPSSRLCLWSDATWAPDYGTFYDNYRSTTGWCATSGSNLLNWNSHRQSVVAQSSAESEWYAAADAAKEAEFLKNLLNDMNIRQSGPVPLLCDNQSTIKQTLNAVDQRSSRHLGMRSHFLRQQCHAGDLELHYVPTQNQLADLYTKCLPAPGHEQLRHSLGILSPAEFRSLQLPQISRGKATSPSSPSEIALKSTTMALRS